MARARRKGLKPRSNDLDISYFDEPEAEDAGEVVNKKPVPSKKKTSSKGPSAANVSQSSARPVHDYDEAAGEQRSKLSKKARASLEEWQGDQRFRKRDVFFKAMADRAKVKFGHRSVFAAHELDKLVIGIPMPSLALEYLIENDVMPLSLVTIIVGPWGSGKSALLYDIYRWFAKFGGGAVHQEVETKFSNDLCSSIMGIDVDSDACPIIVNRCKTLEDWQKRLTYFVKDQKKQLKGTKEEPGPGRTIPVAFGVDSIMAKATEENQEKVSEEGSAGPGYPREALSISRYMAGGVSHWIDNWPFSLFLINHLKKSIDTKSGEVVERSPGGDFAKFQESFELRTSVWKIKIDTADFDGLGVRIHCAKNSFGATGRRIKTRMLWWDEPEEQDKGPPTYRRRTVWDWDWTTITMLNDLPEKMKKRLKAADIDLTCQSPTADVECLANCRAVGMGKNEFERFHVVGAMIRKNADVMNRIRTALAIKRRPLLKGDYLKQLDELKEALP